MSLTYICTYGIIRRCVPNIEMLSVLEACHSSLIGGNHGGIRTTQRFYSVGTIGKPSTKMLMISPNDVDRCQRDGGISKRHELPLNPILVIDLFDVWGSEFIGSFMSSQGEKLYSCGFLVCVNVIGSNCAPKQLRELCDHIFEEYYLFEIRYTLRHY